MIFEFFFQNNIAIEIKSYNCKWVGKSLKLLEDIKKEIG